MTKLLEQALELVRRLPADTQDEIARAMLTLADDGENTSRSIPRTCQIFWKAWHKPSVANSRPTLKSRLPFAASIDEAAVYAVRWRILPRSLITSRLGTRRQPSAFGPRSIRACKTSCCFHMSAGFSRPKAFVNLSHGAMRISSTTRWTMRLRRSSFSASSIRRSGGSMTMHSLVGTLPIARPSRSEKEETNAQPRRAGRRCALRFSARRDWGWRQHQQRSYQSLYR